MLDVNELSLDGAEPSLSTGASALPEEAMAISRTVADDTSDLTYSLVGDSPTGLTFNTDGTGSFDPFVRRKC